MLHRRIRERAKNKQSSRRLRRARRREFPFVAGQPVKSRRRHRDRHRDRLPEQRRAHIAWSDAGKNPVIKFQPFPAGSVFAEGNFIQRTTVEIIADVFRQLAPRAVQILFRVAALVARLDGPAVVEDHAMDFEHRVVLLHLVGVLEEGTHHPGVRQDDVDALHGLFGGHGHPSPLAG